MNATAHVIQTAVDHFWSLWNCDQSAPTTGSSPTTITSPLRGGPSGPRPVSTDVHSPQRCGMQRWLILCDFCCPKLDSRWLQHITIYIYYIQYTPYYSCIIPQIHWLTLFTYSIILIIIVPFEALGANPLPISENSKVAESLADTPGVLGLNIINEPFPGNFYEEIALTAVLLISWEPLETSWHQ